MLNVVDEFTRECLAIRVARKLKALVPLRSHLSVLVLARRPYLRADHFDGGGSTGRAFGEQVSAGE